MKRKSFILSLGAFGVTGLLKGAPRIFDGSNGAGWFVGKRVGIIGLDTSHSTAFATELNQAVNGSKYFGCEVVAAYPYGSLSIASSASRIDSYSKELAGMGIKIVDSIEELLLSVDHVLLLTNDGGLHLEQAIKVINARKPLFIDKPMAASLVDGQRILAAANCAGVPVFSSSALRFGTVMRSLRSGEAVGQVVGVDVYCPADLEPTHPDLFWYGVHGVEMLYAAMGTGCVSVTRTHDQGTDMVVGKWNDGRIGSLRGIRRGAAVYGGTVFGSEGVLRLPGYEGYGVLIDQIVRFFQTGVSPVSNSEMLEVLAFMEAADRSKKTGQPSNPQELLSSIEHI